MIRTEPTARGERLRRLLSSSMGPFAYVERDRIVRLHGFLNRVTAVEEEYPPGIAPPEPWDDETGRVHEVDGTVTVRRQPVTLVTSALGLAAAWASTAQVQLAFHAGLAFGKAVYRRNMLCACKSTWGNGWCTNCDSFPPGAKPLVGP